ncbi:TolC family protein [Sphingobacterium psychroaquaticum]|nr:TolC family protein [Sphingobacterium psychroaquaticum]
MKKYSMAFAFFCGAIGSCTYVYGQEHHTLKSQKTLNNLWAEVEQRYPGIAAYQYGIEAAVLQEQVVKSNALPEVKVQLQNTYGTYAGSAGAVFPQPGFFNVSGAGMPVTGSALSVNTFGSTTVDWEVFSFGRLQAENRSAKVDTEKKRSDKEGYLIQLKKILAERYIAVLYGELKLQWNGKNVARLAAIREITRGLSAAGLRPAADSLLALSSYNQARGDQAQWRGARAAEEVRLSELVDSRSIDYEAALHKFFITDEVEGTPGNIPAPGQHPTLVGLELEAMRYALEADVQQRNAYPSIRLLGGYAYRGSSINPQGVVSSHWIDGFSNKTNNFLTGVGVTWNLTGGYRGKLKRKSLLQESERVEKLHQQYTQVLAADLRAVEVRRIQQQEQLLQLTQGEKQALAAYDMYLARYRTGLISLSELLQIRLLLEQAENNRLEATYAYWRLLTDQAALTTDFTYIFNNL